VTPDPWIDMVADREKGLRLEALTAGSSFDAMVREYWAITPETPRELAARFIAHVRDAEARTREWLQLLDAPGKESAGQRWLDIGCGTADLAAAAPNATVVGIDVAFRWLVVARRRLSERGVEPLLVCCNAEALPFPDGYFSRAFALGALEYCEDLNTALRETRRVLIAGSVFHARTGNRHSVMRNRSGFRFYWPKDAGELYRGLHDAGFQPVEVEAARVLTVEGARLPKTLQRLLPLYQNLRRTPGVRIPARWFAPELEARAVAS
jgi:SAM-dependent methyltransferase